MRLYRRTLALPGMRTLLVLVFFARIPMSAAGMLLTLHVAVGLGRGYGAAGTAGAVVTIGIALGATLMGRFVDRYGLRPMILITTVGEVTFWVFARYLSYPWLLVAGLAGGLLTLPVMSIGRQAIAALVPPDLRRTAFSMDSIFTELAFMIGPAMAVLVVTRYSSTTGMLVMAVAVTTAGAALLVVNPAVRNEAERATATGKRLPRRVWLTPRMVAVLVVAAGAVFILGGTEVAVVAQLRANDELSYTGLVMIAWSGSSAIGGVIYGALTRAPGQITLMAWLGLLTVPIGLAGGEWWLLALVLLPGSALCAPTIAATGEEISRLAPVEARGEATGMQSSAFTLGQAAGAPMVGFVVDHSSPAWGFAVAGVGGVLVAGLAALLVAKQRRAEPVATVPV